ncbi:MAG TPA: nuclear transport factor 2 family protein [Gaiellaceae bacterium]|nr:nuclear transport factor 2 family protein [Gaiellaceae bacterium]
MTLAEAAAALDDAVRSGEAEAAARLLHDEFELTSSLGTGLHVPREAWLENIGAIRTEELSGRDAQVQEFGDVGVAVWRMDWQASWGDDDLSGPYLVSDVWLRDAGSWRLRWRTWARLNAEFLVEELAR